MSFYQHLLLQHYTELSQSV